MTLHVLPRDETASRCETAAAAPSPSSPRPFAPPAEFEDYVLIQPLGSGAMGSVYLAEDTLLARRVAIKFVAAGRTAEGRQRFLLEARAAARIQHPNVVSIYRVGELDQQPFLISEFVRGQTLEQMEKPLPWRRALAIGIELSRGLAAAHRQGVLHCDIKCANAIVAEDGTAKLLDFGLATLAQPIGGGSAPDRATSDDRRRTHLEGTPDNMAPELWRGEGPTPQTDVYALGVVLYELCAGATPFSHVRLANLAFAVNHDDPEPLRRRAPDVDPALAAVVDRCLRRDPEARYAGGDALRDALEAIERRGLVAVLPEGNPYRGLRAFDVEHRGLFFGRGPEIGVLVDRLRSEPLLVIAGESGVGKSSLLRAGLLSAVMDGALGGERVFSAAVVLPGRRPLAALAAALGPAAGLDAAAAEALLAAEPGTFAHTLASRLGERRGLVVAIDPADDLVTLADRADADQAGAALCALASGAPGLRVVATLRADLLTRLATLQPLGAALVRALMLLGPVPPERLEAVVAAPARAKGVRFEDDAMIAELVAAAGGGGGLPLLQFALAELWEARDRDAAVITRAALARLGGASAALIRHADAVVAGLPAPARAEARRILVTLADGDARLTPPTEAELTHGDATARAALDALVQGRLVVARDDGGSGSYAISHEVLRTSWEALRGWALQDAEDVNVRARLAAATAEWLHAGGASDALWGKQRLSALEGVVVEALPSEQRAFVRASRRAGLRRRIAWAAALLGVPLAVGATAEAVALRAAHQRARQVDGEIREAQASLRKAHAAADDQRSLAHQAFARFDGGDRAAGNALWPQALEARVLFDREATVASNRLEAALVLDPGRPEVRAALADVLLERALAADREGRDTQSFELAARFEVYDRDGSRRARWAARSQASFAVAPAGATVRIEHYVERSGRLELEPIGAPMSAPCTLTFGDGAYVARLEAPGRVAITYPLSFERDPEQIAIEVELPRPDEVPDDFVYVPAGRFLFGSAADESARRGFFDTVPIHEVRTAPYLIGRHEVTFGDYIRFLEAQPADIRAKRAPSAALKLGGSGVRLEAIGGGDYRLTLQLGDRTLSAQSGELLRYPNRGRRAAQDWLRFPVTGVSAEDATAYAAWLASTGRVPDARLCTELEWERGARGADDREYPHGSSLAEDDVNLDETYGRDAAGPDVVGAHPASVSPFGLYDMSGNAFEWTTSSLERGEWVARGGSYTYDRKTNQLTNRMAAAASLREASLGFRLCATPRSGM